MNPPLHSSDNGRQLTPEEIAGSLTAMQEVFRTFRPLIRERAGKVEYADKHDGSPVTDTDVEIENALLAELAQRFPGVPVFGEETGYADNLPVAFWLVDPIDGTQSFIENIPAYTSMAVLVQNNEAIACVIYDPSRDVMFTAQKGRGAYKDAVRLDLGSMPLPTVALCKGRFVNELDDIMQPKGVTCEVPPAGIGHGFTRVAEGLAAARFQLQGRGYTHDYAPGALLVREAGGAVVPIKDDVYTYETRSFVVCHPELESTIRQHVQRIRTLEEASIQE